MIDSSSSKVVIENITFSEIRNANLIWLNQGSLEMTNTNITNISCSFLESWFTKVNFVNCWFSNNLLEVEEDFIWVFDHSEMNMSNTWFEQMA